MGEGRLSEDEDNEKAKDEKASEAFAHDLNLSSGRLTPDVEEINFENPSEGLAEKDNQFEVQSLSLSEKMSVKDAALEKEMVKEVCDEITLDVVDSIVSEAHEGERVSGLQRQVRDSFGQS